MGRYFETTRTHTYTLLFALPLLVLYELGAMLIADRGGGGMRNGADVLLRTLLAAGGVQGTLAFTAVLAVGAAVLVALERRKKRVPLRGGYFALMLGESAVYAVVFGFIVAAATQLLLGSMVRLAADGGITQMPLLDGVVLSLGAGIYEELLFRVILTGGLFALMLAAGIRRQTAGIFAIVISAFVFSAFHYIGPYAYPLELNSFTFRMLAGLAFSALYLWRGFGVAAWTHALYDVFLVLAQRG
jgi:membrane protease YdiL (CAAX protease family)